MPTSTAVGEGFHALPSDFYVFFREGVEVLPYEINK